MLSENSEMTAGITLPTASVVIAKVKNIKQTSARIIRPSWLSPVADIAVSPGSGSRRFVAIVCSEVYRWRVGHR
jgi:hypothetical protein